MDKTDKNILAVGLGLLLVMSSNIIGHFAAPFSIFATPVVVTIIIAGINSTLYQVNFFLTVLYGFALLLFNDLFIRFYAGGTHDQEGKGWIAMFFIISFVLAFFSMAVYAVKIDNIKQGGKTKAILMNLLFLITTAALTGLFYFYFIADI